MRRPGNVASVEGWTGHKIPKGIVQNSLEELAKSGELSVTGKTGKVYWFNQVSEFFFVSIPLKSRMFICSYPLLSSTKSLIFTGVSACHRINLELKALT